LDGEIDELDSTVLDHNIHSIDHNSVVHMAPQNMSFHSDALILDGNNRTYDEICKAVGTETDAVMLQPGLNDYHISHEVQTRSRNINNGSCISDTGTVESTVKCCICFDKLSINIYIPSESSESKPASWKTLNVLPWTLILHSQQEL
jgi:hypothetical protein